MAYETMVGSELAISASLPATDDVAGYAALTYTPIGEVTDNGEMVANAQEITHETVKEGIVKKGKGSKNYGTRPVALALDLNDAGQIICEAAFDDNAPYSFRETWQSGVVVYYQAITLSYPYASGGGPNAVRSGTLQQSVTTKPVIDISGA